MSTTCLAALVLLAAELALAEETPHAAAPVAMPSLARTIPLPGVAGPIDRSGIRGRIDHLAYDAVNRRLLVACIANGSLEVVDLDQGKPIKSIAGLKKPQGVAIAGDLRLAIVSTGGDGMAHFFDLQSLREKAVLPAGEDADNVRIAPTERRMSALAATKVRAG